MYSLFNLKADPTENAISSNPSILAMGGCLAIDWISFPWEHVYEPLPSNAYPFSRSFHNNGSTRYNMDSYYFIFSQIYAVISQKVTQISLGYCCQVAQELRFKMVNKNIFFG
jgi:hypothetical protein